MQCLDWVGFITFAVKFAVLLICASMRVLVFTSAEAVGERGGEAVGGSGVSPLGCLRVRWNEMAAHVDPCAERHTFGCSLSHRSY